MTRIVAQMLALALIAGVAAGWYPMPGAAPDVATPAVPPAVTIPAVAARDDAGAFPLAGRWRFAASGGLLPRASGCGPDDATLELSARALTLVRGDWRQTVFPIAGWRLKGDADLELRLAGSGSPLTDRARITLDASSAGFLRFRAAATADGVPLERAVARLPEAQRAAARAELDQIAGALTLLRCPDVGPNAVSAAAALLRGPVAAAKTQWVLR